MREKFIIRTNYFGNPFTWVKRSLLAMLILSFTYWVSSESKNDDYLWILYTLIILGSCYAILRPVEELAVSKERLFYIRKSLIPYLNKTEEYKLSDIKSIGCGGFFDADIELFSRGKRVNRLEIIFNDNSSKALDVRIYKKDLKLIVKKVISLLNTRIG